MFGFLSGLASAFIPGAAAILGPLGLARQAFSLIAGRPGPPAPPWPPPGFHIVFGPSHGGQEAGGERETLVADTPSEVHPVAEMNGGAAVSADTPFVGGAAISEGQPQAIDVGGPLEAQHSLLPPPATADVGGGFDLPGLISGARNLLGGIIPSADAGMVVGAGLAQGATQLVGGAGVRGMIPAIENVVGRTLITAGIGGAIYETYKALRLRGFAHKIAKRLAHLFHGVHRKRRRMRVTNIHALRRAIRRVHGFKRVARKVGALGVSRTRFISGGHRRRRARRGDLDPFMIEDLVDMQDEAEDLGYDPDSFRSSESNVEAVE
jgi:hypothetical protein